MQMLNYIATELKTFGFSEVLYHIAYKRASWDKKPKYQCLMLEEKDKYYNKLDKQGIESALEYLYDRYMHRTLDFEHLSTFTEKIQYLKLNDFNDLKCRLSDKYKVRGWVESKKCKNLYLIPVIEVYDTFSQIDFSILPEQFVLKMNHGSGMNYIVKNKNLTASEYKHIQDVFSWWSRCPFYADTIQFQYKDIKRKIVAEKYIEQIDSDLYDYKVHCFNGEPLFIQCIGSRNLREHTGYQNNFDFEWKKLNWSFEDYPAFVNDIPKPKCLNDMYDIAKKLSEGFKYVRVDLYEIDGKVFFGEMTFTPASGYYPYRGTWTRDVDIEIGRYITI